MVGGYIRWTANKICKWGEFSSSDVTCMQEGLEICLQTRVKGTIFFKFVPQIINLGVKTYMHVDNCTNGFCVYRAISIGSIGGPELQVICVL